MSRGDEGRGSARAPLRYGFGPRLALAISAVILVTCSVLSIVVVRENITEVRRGMYERARSLAGQLAHDGELGMLAGDARRLDELARWGRAQRDVAYCSFIGTNGRVWATQGALVEPRAAHRMVAGETEGPFEAGPDLWEFRSPILTSTRRPHREELGFEPGDNAGEAREPVGVVLVGMSEQNMQALQARTLFAAGSVTLLVALLSVIATMAVAQRMTRPLRYLATAADAIARGNLDAEVAVHSRTEIAQLAASFNTMIVSLRRSRAEIEQSSHNLEQMVLTRTERLVTMNRELEEANQLKSEFLATVSHELRTPLHVILGYTAILDDGSVGTVNEEQRDLLGAIRRYSKLQLDLLTDVLDFSRLQSGKISFHVERFDLEPLLRDIENMYHGRLAGGPVRLNVQVAAGTPPLETDRIKLQEIVRNLLDNAVKFTRVGGISIDAELHSSGEAVVIRVVDSGAGIGAAELPHIFEPFRQIGESRTRQTGGVGLGLSIVKQLSEALGGTCVATSEEGVGSIFQVTVPLRFDDTPPTESPEAPIAG